MTGKLLQEYSRMASGKREAEGVLSPREMEVLKLLALGHRNSEIAYQLFISERTVKAHVSNLLRKLQLSDRMQAAHYAIRNGLIRV
jgi:DNA-binding NarL/FixJ family response regulator